MIQSSSEETVSVITNIVNVINKVSDLTDAIKDAVTQQVTATNDVSNKLMETAYGSKEIFEAIKEVAYTEEAAKDEEEKSTLAEKLRKFTAQ